MTKCKECGNEISTKATACPKCGAKVAAATSAGTMIIGGFFALMIATFVMCSQKADEVRENEAARVAAFTPAERAAAEKQKAAEVVLAAMNDLIEGAGSGCMVDIKHRLKDPDSAKWEEPLFRNPKFSENGQRLTLQLVGRSKNGFGAYTLSVFDCDSRKVGGSWQTIRIKENGK